MNKLHRDISTCWVEVTMNAKAEQDTNEVWNHLGDEEPLDDYMNYHLTKTQLRGYPTLDVPANIWVWSNVRLSQKTGHQAHHHRVSQTVRCQVRVPLGCTLKDIPDQYSIFAVNETLFIFSDISQSRQLPQVANIFLLCTKVLTGKVFSIRHQKKCMNVRNGPLTNSRKNIRLGRQS